MPDYHDVLWKLLFQRIDCAIEFFQFLLKEKSKWLELENLRIIEEISYRKKKLMYDILYEVPIRNSEEKLYFLLEHKSRRAIDFQIQMLKYKLVIHNWQKKEFGKMYSIIPILFYQGLDNWDPVRDFLNLELRAGFLLLKIIRDSWDNFVDGWITIRQILNSMEIICKSVGLSEKELWENGIFWKFIDLSP
jgi:hypothetical protein